jgi:hypothetical protein
MIGTIVETSVGRLRWRIDALTSQEVVRGAYESYMPHPQICRSRKYSFRYWSACWFSFGLLFGLLVGATGRVFAFEPNPILRDSLEGPIRLNRTSRLDGYS